MPREGPVLKEFSGRLGYYAASETLPTSSAGFRADIAVTHRPIRFGGEPEMQRINSGPEEASVQPGTRR